MSCPPGYYETWFYSDCALLTDLVQPLCLWMWSMFFWWVVASYWWLFNQFSSVHSLNHVWLFENPWITAHQASLSITISRRSQKLMFIELVMPSNHLILCHPLLLLPSVFPSFRVFSSESVLCIRWPKYWSFSFNIIPSNEHPGIISCRTDWLDHLASKGLSRVFSSTTVQKHQFFWAQFSLQSNSHIHTWLLEKP